MPLWCLGCWSVSSNNPFCLGCFVFCYINKTRIIQWYCFRDLIKMAAIIITGTYSQNNYSLMLYFVRFIKHFHQQQYEFMIHRTVHFYLLRVMLLFNMTQLRVNPLNVIEFSDTSTMRWCTFSLRNNFWRIFYLVIRHITAWCFHKSLQVDFAIGRYPGYSGAHTPFKPHQCGYAHLSSESQEIGRTCSFGWIYIGTLEIGSPPRYGQEQNN